MFDFLPFIFQKNPDKYLDRANKIELEVHSTKDKSKKNKLRRKVRKNILKYLKRNYIELDDYPLPIRGGRWEITQGNTTKYTHRGHSNRFCWDFELVDHENNFHPEYGRDHKKDSQGNYSMGQLIYAVDSGRLVVGFRDPGNLDSSNIIVIHHRKTPNSPYDGTRSIYDHIADNGFVAGVDDYDSLSAKYAGQYYSPGIDVEQGQIIGVIGDTGTSYSHLHFSIKYRELGNLSLPICFEDYWTDRGDKMPKHYHSGVPLEDNIVGFSQHDIIAPLIPKSLSSHNR